jgi:hypothetical protein
MPMKDQGKHFFANTILFWIFEFAGAIVGAGIGSLLGSFEIGAFIGLIAGGFSYILLSKSKSQDLKN